jgi:glycosyltransferase involved in cell wall biosynthesis
MPCFNAERDLHRALASLAANDEPHDIVMVDDGSAKPLAEFLNPLPHNAVVVQLPTNSGIVAALNTGLSFISKQTYEYVARLDADDWSAPSRLKEQARHLDYYRQCDILGTWFTVCDANGARLWDEQPDTRIRSLNNHLCYRNCFAHSSLMFRVGAVMEAGGYDPLVRRSEDYDLVRRFASRGAIAMLPQTLTYYQLTPGSITSRRGRQFLVHFRVALRHFQPWNMHAYLGLARSMAALLTPRSLVPLLRRLLSGGGRTY